MKIRNSAHPQNKKKYREDFSIHSKYMVKYMGTRDLYNNKGY
jgi:hypothetical protein